MKTLRVIAEAARTAVSQPVASTVTALIVAAVCAVILSTTGQTVQAERQVLAQIDAAGTRSIIITDTQGTAGFTPDAVDRISRLSGVEWVVGLGPATDVRAAGNPGGPPAAVRALHGDPPPQLRMDRTRLRPGVALVGPDAQTTLGLIHPFGGVVGDDVGDLAVVGPFVASDPLSFLNRSLLTAPREDERTLRSIHILTVRPSDVAAVTDAALTVLGPDDPTSVGVETSETLAAIRAAVQGQLGRFGRRLVTIVLAVGLVLAGLNVYGAVTTRRRDFGRRRALGASRPLIVGLVAAQTLVVAVVGAAAGTLATAFVLTRVTGNPPDPPFAVAVATLAVLATTVAALPPALVAAYRDPVRVLRIP